MKTSLVKKLTVAGMAAALLAGVYAPTASAHGEKSQAAFLRMRTVHWYDLKWSTDKLKVNEEMEVTGKFYTYPDWPQSVAKPEIAFLNIGIPGPVFTRQASYIGGTFVPRSVTLNLGKDYDFKVVLKARRPGRWHMHTMMNINGGGPIIGPGKWVEIEGSLADYKDEITTLTGQTVNLETFGTSGVVMWHLFWFVVGVAWIWYWARRPTFIPRFARVASGNEEGLITEGDRKVGIAFLAGSCAIVLFGYVSANSSYPITVPLQAGTIGVMKPISEEEKVIVAVEKAQYRVPGRSINLQVKVTNNSDAPVSLAEFETGGVRFLNADVYKDDTNYPDNLLAEEGLELEDKNPIAPGETRSLKFTATDAAWEVERLADVVYDPDSRFGGLLFWSTADGKRLLSHVGGALIPIFS